MNISFFELHSISFWPIHVMHPLDTQVSAPRILPFAMYNLGFYVISSSFFHLYSGYYSVIYGVGWRTVVRFGNLFSCVSRFSMWCRACTLISVKFNYLINKINMLKKITLKSWPVPKFHNSMCFWDFQKKVHCVLLFVFVLLSPLWL